MTQDNNKTKDEKEKNTTSKEVDLKVEEKKEEVKAKKEEVKEVKEEKKVEEVKEEVAEVKAENKEEAKKEEVKAEKEEEKIPTLRPGMTIRVYQKIKELNIKGEEKERIQYFEGMIIAKKHGSEAGGSITVRKVSDGIGVEKIFPLNLPTITKIEIKKQARVRRAKLYYLKRGYKKKLKEVRV